MTTLEKIQKVLNETKQPKEFEIEIEGFVFKGWAANSNVFQRGVLLDAIIAPDMSRIVIPSNSHYSARVNEKFELINSSLKDIGFDLTLSNKEYRLQTLSAELKFASLLDMVVKILQSMIFL
jgi:hypothetical protein